MVVPLVWLLNILSALLPGMPTVLVSKLFLHMTAKIAKVEIYLIFFHIELSLWIDKKNIHMGHIMDGMFIKEVGEW